MQKNEELQEFVRVLVCRCKRCGHVWNSRNDRPPRACSGCKRANWQTPKVARTATVDAKNGTKKYGFDLIEIGQSQSFPWIVRVDGMPDECANAARNASLSQYQRRSGRKFDRWYDMGTGLNVKRIS